MRDNWNIDELSDQAWIKMREMLDQEMPVDGDSRKPIVFWWFWAAAAVVLIGTATFLFFRPVDSTQAETALAETSQELQEQTPSGPAEETEENTGISTIVPTTEPNNDRTISTQNTPATISNKQNTVETTSAGLKQDHNAEKSIALDHDQEKDPVVASHENEVSEAELQNLSGPENEDSIALEEAPVQSTKIIAEKENLQIIETNLPTVEPQQETALFTLEDLPEQMIAALELEPLPLSRINVYNPKRPLLLPLEVNAGLIAGLESGGITGGMTALRTGIYLHDAARWSFQTGIGFHRQQDPFRISFKSSGNVSEAKADSPNMDNLNNYDPGQGPVFQNLSLSQVVATSDIDVSTTYLDVPILLNWQFARKWGIAAGGRLSWLMATRWKDSSTQESLGIIGSGADFSLALSNSNRQFAVYRVGNNNVPTTLVLNKFYASGTFGLTFRPAARWNLRLQYQHSLTNQLDNAVYQKTDRSLWLSAGLRF